MRERRAAAEALVKRSQLPRKRANDGNALVAVDLVELNHTQIRACTEELRPFSAGLLDQRRFVRWPTRPGSVRNVVEIRSGIISEKLIISYYAARSNC